MSVHVTGGEWSLPAQGNGHAGENETERASGFADESGTAQAIEKAKVNGGEDGYDLGNVRLMGPVLVAGPRPALTESRKCQQRLMAVREPVDQGRPAVPPLRCTAGLGFVETGWSQWPKRPGLDSEK